MVNERDRTTLENKTALSRHDDDDDDEDSLNFEREGNWQIRTKQQGNVQRRIINQRNPAIGYSF